VNALIVGAKSKAERRYWQRVEAAWLARQKKEKNDD